MYTKGIYGWVLIDSLNWPFINISIDTQSTLHVDQQLDWHLDVSQYMAESWLTHMYQSALK